MTPDLNARNPPRPSHEAAEPGKTIGPGRPGDPADPTCLEQADALETLSSAAAMALQKQLAERVVLSHLDVPRLLGGADVSYRRGDTYMYAAVVVWDRLTRRIIDRASAVRPPRFPYIPGLLSFREAPAVVAAYRQLRILPDLLMCDGQGLAHPRRFGLACHLGLILDLPTLGCAKTRLTGIHAEPGIQRGERTELRDASGEQIGTVLRTKRRVNPLYVSPGHRMDFESAVEAVLAADGGYRIPEPTRQAHIYVNELRRGG